LAAWLRQIQLRTSHELMPSALVKMQETSLR
jgi:hypothetical protein